MSDSNSKPKKLSRWTRIRNSALEFLKRLCVYLLIYLFASIISIGPMFWVWYEAVYVNGSVLVAKFYAPLVWLCDHIPWLSELVNRYINWWIL